MRSLVCPAEAKLKRTLLALIEAAYALAKGDLEMPLPRSRDTNDFPEQLFGRLYFDLVRTRIHLKQTAATRRK